MHPQTLADLENWFTGLRGQIMVQKIEDLQQTKIQCWQKKSYKILAKIDSAHKMYQF